MLTPRAWLAPHLPTLLVDEHRGHRTPMLEAFESARERLREAAPSTVLVVSARWVSNGPFLTDAGRQHRTITDYSGLGVEVRYDCAGAPALAKALAQAGTSAKLRTATASRGVDSGVTVPMHFLAPQREFPIVPLSLAEQPLDRCRAWGAVIHRVLSEWPEPVALVVGGLLSFDAHAWSLGRATPQVEEFDGQLLELLGAGQWSDLESARERARAASDPDRGAGAVQVECDLRHLEILRGFLGPSVRAERLAYESHPGVGAALLEFELPQPAVVDDAPHAEGEQPAS